ncbi:MAG: LytR C-terminal domain-containing protein [Brevinematia bacterium]
MITVNEYRKRSKPKKKQLRSWVSLLFIFILSAILVVLLSSLTNNRTTISFNNIFLRDNEILVFLTDTDTKNSFLFDYVTNKILELSQKVSSTDLVVKMFLDSKLISCYSFSSPDVTVLNGKGENNLAMNVSITLIREGFRVRNYHNYISNIPKSIILNRSHNDKLVKEISKTLGITNISNFIFDESLKDNLSGIVVILGQDFSLRRSNTEPKY